MLKKILKDYKKQTSKVSIGRIGTSIMVITFISFMIIMIEYAIPSKDIDLIIKLGIIYFIVNIFRGLVTIYEDINHDSFEKEVEADYREKIFFKLQKMNMKELDKIKVGEILENIINDTKEFSKYYTYGICRAYFGGALRLVGTLAVLMYLDVRIVTITLFIYLIGFSVTFFINKKSIKFMALKREANAKIINWSNEQVQGYQTIKALEVEQQRIREIKILIKEYEKAVQRLEKNIRLYTCLYEFMISFVGVANILVGTISVEKGVLSYGALIVLTRYIDQPEVYAKWVIEGFQYRNVGRISYEKINAILDKKEENIDKGKELETTTTTTIENIEFKNVNFSYNENQNVLNNISLKVSKNESVALVGRTGSGKTSMVNLICRFYELQDGKITINGIDYKKYSIKSLRSKIGYIMQKVVIFDGTILENINYANKDISKEEIIEICKKLNLHEKIMSLKDGYETKISSDTDLFSAGEKQLLNFSRIMVENPEIIILDEATASLSYKSEMLVRKGIEEITKNKISFIIAHRLSTIKNCDKILLMNGGKIVEQGNHEELMAEKGEYYQLVNV